MTKNQDKSFVWENKGDKLLAAGKEKKAFEAFQQALELNPERLALYDKIISLHEKHVQNWNEKDFAYNLSLTMKKQELQDPTFKRIHARFEPDYQTVLALIKKLFAAKTRETETKTVEDIVSFGSKAIYPLVDYLLGFKEIGKNRKQKEKSNE